MKRGLEDVKIVEYGDFIGVPFCSKLLADLGADVIKIEKPEGDTSRKYGPFPEDIPDHESSGLYVYLNTNKRGITLNLEKATGKQLFRQLIGDADILIEDMMPGETQQLGLDYDSLKAINPRLVVTSITPFGQTGPYRNYTGSGLIFWHMSGAGLITPRNIESVEQEPLRVLNLADYVAGMTASVAILCALRVQRHMNLGQQVDISRLEALARMAAWTTSNWAYEHENPSRISKANLAPYHFIQCKDGWVFAACPNEHQWDRFVDMMGNPDWVKEDLFKDLTLRAANWDSLESLIVSWSSMYTKNEIFEIGKSKGIPIAPVNTIDEIMENRQLRERGFFVDIEHPTAGKLVAPGAPYKSSSLPWSIRKAAPSLGEHNKEVYCRQLGYSDVELIKLYQTEVI